MLVEDEGASARVGAEAEGGGGSGGEGGGGATAEAEARVEAGGARGGGRARRVSRRHEVELEKRIALLQDLERRRLACGVCGVRGVYMHM